MTVTAIVRFLRILLVSALLIGIIVLGSWYYAVRWRPEVKDFPVQGVDVSADDGSIQWRDLKGAGADFGYARATFGAYGRDPRFADNMAGMAEAGVRRGAIHVYSLCRRAADQAANFVRTVPREKDQLPMAVSLDFQENCGVRPDREVVIGELTRFLVTVETHMGKPALLMVAKPFEEQYRIAEAIPRSLWSMNNFSQPEYLSRPWQIWRANDRRHVVGTEMPIHWDVVAS